MVKEMERDGQTAGRPAVRHTPRPVQSRSRERRCHRSLTAPSDHTHYCNKNMSVLLVMQFLLFSGCEIVPSQSASPSVPFQGADRQRLPTRLITSEVLFMMLLQSRSVELWFCQEYIKVEGRFHFQVLQIRVCVCVCVLLSFQQIDRNGPELAALSALPLGCVEDKCPLHSPEERPVGTLAVAIPVLPPSAANSPDTSVLGQSTMCQPALPPDCIYSSDMLNTSVKFNI